MEGKVAIVTGGAGGLGSEICRRFSMRGAAVAVADVNGFLNSGFYQDPES